MLYIVTAITAIISAAAILMGVTQWVKRDVWRGMLYTSLGLFFLANVSMVSLVNLFVAAVDQRLEQHGVEQLFPDQQDPGCDENGVCG